MVRAGGGETTRQQASGERRRSAHELVKQSKNNTPDCQTGGVSKETVLQLAKRREQGSTDFESMLGNGGEKKPSQQ